jgi:LacI family transcriptional regulator
MPDSRPVTIHDVARRAGVAVSSVSRVLSNHPDVSSAMKAKVESAANELGYSPDPVAQSLRSGTTHLIGLVVRDYANPFFGEVISGIEEVLTDAGYTLLVTSSGREAAQETERISMLRQRRVDAILLATVSDKSPSTRKAIAAFKKPVVLLDREFARLSTGSILLDHASGVQAATADLLSLGHRRIALITGTPDIRPTRERVRGFEDAYRAAELDPSEATEVAEVFSASFAHDKTVELLRLPPRQRPTALVAGGVQATIGILEAISELGLRLGDDVSLVVCDDLPWLRAMRPRISAVSRDAVGMGRAAADMVLSLIRGEEPHTVILPTTYDPRDTTRPISGSSTRRRVSAQAR